MDTDSQKRLEDVETRLEILERMTGMDRFRPAEGFDPMEFRGAMLFYSMILLAVIIVVVILMQFPVNGLFLGSESTIFGVPMFSRGPGSGGPLGGMVGIVSTGGLAVGVVAVGGCAVGVVACGGCGIGLIALGGGACGLIAIGGGACGVIAIGGGASGMYVLAGEGRGRYVFDYRRQDEQAVRFFCGVLPRLRRAFPGRDVL